MYGYILVFLFLSVAFSEGFIFGTTTKCPIKKYKSGKYITGDDLLIHPDFNDLVKALESVAKDCKVHVFVKGSYYQLSSPGQQVPIAERDLAIGHGFQFEVRTESNAVLCNTLCLSRNPTDLPEVKCLLQGATKRGLTWTRYDSNILSDGTYASNPNGYSALKMDIQTKCQNAKLKRTLLRELRKLYEEEEFEKEDNDADEKKK